MRRKHWKTAALSACVLGALVLGQCMAGAAYENPYQYPKAIDTATVNEAAYMDNKTKNLFTGPRRPAPPYVVPKGWKQDLTSMKSVRVEKYTPDRKGTDRILFYLHGGGYFEGLGGNHRDWAMALSHALGQGDVYLLDYRLSSEALYPAALDDAEAAYKAILASGVPADRIILGGDSTGGNLATALALYCRDNKLPIPGLLVLYSPWEDAEKLPTHVTKVREDIVLGERNPNMLHAVTESQEYFGKTSLEDPYVSPVYADLKGLPPTLIIGGGSEMFLDDMLLFAGHAQSDGVAVETHLFPGLSHDWPLTFPEIPEAKDAFSILSSFADKYMGK